MRYWDFEKALHAFPVFSLADVVKQYPAFRRQNLVDWQDKGYVKKITNKWYRFTQITLTEELRYRISNNLRRPSYISLESAFAYYNFIPEAVYSQTAVTTQTTISYHTEDGDYHYRSLKPSCFFGYRVLTLGHFPVLIAEPEKAILDFVYLHPQCASLEDFEAMRFDLTALQDEMDWKKLNLYATCFQSKTLQKRIAVLQKMIADAHALSN